MANVHRQPEIWLPIQGFETFYEVSNHGRIRRLPYQFKSPRFKGCYSDHKIMSVKTISHKYLSINLYTFKSVKDHKRFYVHRLVAAHFIGQIPAGYEVNHKDFDRYNNYFENLEITTPLENTAHSIKHQGVKHASPIHAKNLETNEITGYRSIRDASINLCTSPSVIQWRIKSGKPYNGFTFTKIAS